jgi:hypothetical protein
MKIRDQYMAALEAASVDGDIKPFANFIANEMRAEISASASNQITY